jgi:hypothetical protein
MRRARDALDEAARHGSAPTASAGFGCRIAFSFSGLSQAAHRDLTPWLGMEDSNSEMSARGMYLRFAPASDAVRAAGRG